MHGILTVKDLIEVKEQVLSEIDALHSVPPHKHINPLLGVEMAPVSETDFPGIYYVPAYLVFPLSRHGSVRRVLEDAKCGKVPCWRKLLWASQATSAIQHIHEHDAFHRDIKAENFLIMDDGDIRLIDFGQVKNLGEEASNGKHTGKIFFEYDEHVIFICCISIDTDFNSYSTFSCRWN